ncbi:MAG: SH3 domain-containing protein [Bacteroidaceae bacterium]|nr:SH3 domain-containing protein [Bacteroidaceae bacterium]
MKRIFILLFLQILLVPCHAAEPAELKSQADSLYSKEAYSEAAALYAEVADQVQSADVCYNLGCCYYRMDDMAHAVLWFERAALLAPGDKDIRFNLELARSKTIDRITPRHEMFFVSLFRSLTQMFSLGQWSAICISLFVLTLLAFAVFLYSSKYILRQTGFYAAVLLLLLVVLGNVCAHQQRRFAQERSSAIIVASSVTVRSTPSQSGNELFVLHEGTRVEIRDNSMKEWCEVQIADGKVGWLERRDMEVI